MLFSGVCWDLSFPPCQSPPVWRSLIMLLKRDSMTPHQVASLEMYFLTARTPKSDDFSVARHALRQSPLKITSGLTLCRSTSVYGRHTDSFQQQPLLWPSSVPWQPRALLFSHSLFLGNEPSQSLKSQMLVSDPTKLWAYLWLRW